ncbi:MAG TPA: 2-phospho-L-lactate transferase [Acidimicrobiia bacterium]|jgi:LPPG:FO 2-phospho-L-lactate transferase|nr:2-phospho-L-lactate transferase [Acidimicrobiia bacterium]
MLAALAGGVGAARFLAGLVRVVAPSELFVVANTADDEEFHGLHVSPDIDSVIYTLAGASNAAQGWGLEGETFATLESLARFDVPTWFRLGDKDLATHLFRTQRLNAGASLADVTAEITKAWDLDLRIVPMTNDRVRTRITVERDRGTDELAMQEWFVRERAEPPVLSVRFDGAEQAQPAPDVLEALRNADTIVICPSNPVISIGPILAVPGIREVLEQRRPRVVAVSPIVGGAPVKGPADRLMAPLGIDVSCVGVARAYSSFCSSLVIDAVDAARAGEVESAGVRAVVADTMMRSPEIAAALAKQTLAAVA